MEHVPPLAVTLNDVVVDTEALLAAAMSRNSDDDCLRDLARLVGELKRDMAAVAADESACLERCQFSLYALIDVARSCCNGLDLDDPMRVTGATCRRKAQATLFTVQWLLARRVQQHA